MLSSIHTLNARLKDLTSKVGNGQKILAQQSAQSAKLNKRIKYSRTRLQALIKQLDVLITDSCRQRLADLRLATVANYERAEQGLVHIFQGIAENKTAKKNRLDGRYSR